ncbi:serine/threonine-protein kinase [Amycolatopsis orientalis]|uniref:serine/threonine-protein kinase n=1 Tax=Amycolatopsis orientalis TaxID=31958 RepID=UPI00068576F9|nr:serine/threonine-protein kinase [Amycolatopsis orientalis]
MTDAGDSDAATTARRFALGRYGPAPLVLAGRYELGEQIGEGATACVHRAEDRETGAEVAVKLFHAGAVELGRNRRGQEIAALRAVRHPGLVGFVDAGVDEEYAYLVMDFVPGPTLSEWLRCGPLPAGQVEELGAQLAEALAHVHAHEVTHRDLKPANILMSGDGPRIADFGVARIVDATRVTETGAVVGTAAYLSPEQVLGERPGPASDVYALGLVLLECLTGVREYPGTAAETAVVRLHRAPRVPPGTPEPLARTLRAMTMRAPEERPSATAVARALRGTETLRLPVKTRLAVFCRRHHVSRRRAVLAAGLPVVLVAAGTLLLATPLRPSTGSAPVPEPAPVPVSPPSSAPSDSPASAPRHSSSAPPVRSTNAETPARTTPAPRTQPSQAGQPSRPGRTPPKTPPGQTKQPRNPAAGPPGDKTPH